MPQGTSSSATVDESSSYASNGFALAVTTIIKYCLQLVAVPTTEAKMYANMYKHVYRVSNCIFKLCDVSICIHSPGNYDEN